MLSDAEKYERGLRYKALLMKIERAALEDQNLEAEAEPEEPTHKAPKVIRTSKGYIWR